MLMVHRYPLPSFLNELHIATLGFFVCFLSILFMRFILTLLVLAHSLSLLYSIPFLDTSVDILYCWKTRFPPIFCYYSTETVLLHFYISPYVHVPKGKPRSGPSGSWMNASQLYKMLTDYCSKLPY